MLKKIILYFFMCVLTYSFEVSDIRFDKVVGKGEKVSKNYILGNTGEKEIMYKLSIEGSKNIKIRPNVIRLKPNETKKFDIEVTGKGKAGKYNYYFIAQEMELPELKSEEGVKVLKTIKIFQEYEIK